MKQVSGQCLCGTVKFKFKTEELKAYQCYCSICRKATGSAYSTTLMAPVSEFEWISGEEKLSSYSKVNGYKVNFCSNCGSPVPNIFRNLPLYSIPVGSLDGEHEIDVVVQIYLGSMASWETDDLNGKKYIEMPSLSEMMEFLHVRKMGSK